MKVVPLKKKHPSGFWTIFYNLDLNEIFKKRDKDWFNSDRDFCVYVWRDPNKNVQYIGMGRYWDLAKYTPSKWRVSRPYNHRQDMLSNTIDKDWVCEILTMGCTSKEAHIIESYLIVYTNRKFSKRGQYIWDGDSLINKKREKRYEGMFKEYLNLDNGNNYWETCGWKIDNN